MSLKSISTASLPSDRARIGVLSANDVKGKYTNAETGSYDSSVIPTIS